MDDDFYEWWGWYLTDKKARRDADRFAEEAGDSPDDPNKGD